MDKIQPKILQQMDRILILIRLKIKLLVYQIKLQILHKILHKIQHKIIQAIRHKVYKLKIILNTATLQIRTK